MYLINQINEDYEGTWSNPLMYENDVDKAIMIVKDLQEAMISLRRKYLQIREDINFILETKYPNFHSNDMNLTIEEQIKSMDENEEDDYFTKKEKLLENATKLLSEKEKFLYDISSIDSSSKLIYFNVKKIELSDDMLSTKVDKEQFWKVIYSTRDLAEKYESLFNQY